MGYRPILPEGVFMVVLGFCVHWIGCPMHQIGCSVHRTGAPPYFSREHVFVFWVFGAQDWVSGAPDKYM
jgi:hypothetical protein